VLIIVFAVLDKSKFSDVIRESNINHYNQPKLLKGDHMNIKNTIASKLPPRICLKSLDSCDTSTPNMTYTHEQKSILRLIRTDQIGAVTFHKLMRKYGSAKAALGHSKRHSNR
jgi:hypothetical protein